MAGLSARARPHVDFRDGTLFPPLAREPGRFFRGTPLVQHGERLDTDSRQTVHSNARVQPETFRARALTASLTVRDLQQSLAWYRDVIGFTVDQRHEREGMLRAVSLKAGTVRILINQDDGARGADRVKGQGFSLQFTTAQNIDELAQRITAQGVVLESEPADMPWGVRVFRLKDPDGYRLVISSEK